MPLDPDYLASLSQEARRAIESVPTHAERSPLPELNDHNGWQAVQARIETQMQPACDQSLARFQPTLRKARFADLNTIIIEPKNSHRDATPAIYIHGGAYVGFSAHSSLSATIPIAHTLERSIISIDYPLAPFSTFEKTVPKTASTLQAILERYPNAALIGDSAGGGLALAAVLHLIDEGAPRPTGITLISPWTDLADRGDSRRTMAPYDPILNYDSSLRVCAEAYAGDELDHPHASPVFGTYSKDFPQTFIQCSSREILLSDSLRLYDVLKRTGVAAHLDIHDGLFHSFSTIAPNSPEARLAWATIRNFIEQ